MTPPHSAYTENVMGLLKNVQTKIWVTGKRRGVSLYRHATWGWGIDTGNEAFWHRFWYNRESTAPSFITPRKTIACYLLCLPELEGKGRKDFSCLH